MAESNNACYVKFDVTKMCAPVISGAAGLSRVTWLLKWAQRENAVAADRF